MTTLEDLDVEEQIRLLGEIRDETTTHLAFGISVVVATVAASPVILEAFAGGRSAAEALAWYAIALSIAWWAATGIVRILARPDRSAAQGASAEAPAGSASTDAGLNSFSTGLDD